MDRTVKESDGYTENCRSLDVEMNDKPVIRLAFRIEGDKWTCYCAKSDTMDGALWMGSIMMSIVQHKDRKQAFMDLMRDALGEFLTERLGGDIKSWSTEPAPESERSGRA
jgi:hypothetical protein